MAICTGAVALLFSGESLADMDIFSKSDPYLVLYAQDPGGRLREVGRTETADDSTKPVWKKEIVVNYHFESRQTFVAKIYDHDGHDTDHAKNDFLGEVPFELAHVLASKGQTRRLLVQPPGKGTLIVSGVEVTAPRRDTVQLEFSATGLKQVAMCGKNNCFLKVLRILPGGTTKPITQTDVCKNTLDPTWPALPSIKLTELAKSREMTEKIIRLEVWHNGLFSSDSLGSVDCSLAELLELQGPEGPPLPLRNPAYRQEILGQLFTRSAAIQHYPSFVELLKKGLQINMALSIDFSASNGDPHQPTSLHYLANPLRPNQYVCAIHEVGAILLEYDADKMVPAFGFGAIVKTRPGGGASSPPVPALLAPVSHFFHLNHEANPYVSGLEGILAAYAKTMSAVTFSGPTNFAPTIRGVTTGARNDYLNAGVYTVLLIITDGEITDMNATIDAIVAADDAPLSIVIVGVGKQSDFISMSILDSDVEPLRTQSVAAGGSGRVSRRDVVQFVPIAEFVHRVQGDLAAAVLEEIPRQVEEWWVIANPIDQLNDFSRSIGLFNAPEHPLLRGGKRNSSLTFLDPALPGTAGRPKVVDGGDEQRQAHHRRSSEPRVFESYGAITPPHGAIVSPPQGAIFTPPQGTIVAEEGGPFSKSVF